MHTYTQTKTYTLMQVVDIMHCGYLKTLLARPDFDNALLPKNYVYTCRWTVNPPPPEHTHLRSHAHFSWIQMIVNTARDGSRKIWIRYAYVDAETLIFGIHICIHTNGMHTHLHCAEPDAQVRCAASR